MPRAAVVLSGCGVFDGSEIREAVSVLIHLSRAGAETAIFAPDIKAPAVNHLTGKPEPAGRSVLAESARIARGEITALTKLDAHGFDLLVFPGGFGAAKNLCDFAAKGADCTVHPEVARVVKEFHAARKPIALCCIAPVLAARLLGAAPGGCILTVGGTSDASAAVERMGARHVIAGAEKAVVDERNRLVTTPAYMCEAPLHEIHDGIGAMIDKALELVGAAGAR